MSLGVLSVYDFQHIYIIVVLVQATLSALEEKLSLSRSEVEQVKASMKQYESLVDSYKFQVCSSHYCIFTHTVGLVFNHRTPH